MIDQTKFKISLLSWIHLIALAFIGSLFIVKYAPRISVPPVLALPSFLLIFGLQIAVALGLSYWINKLGRPKVFLGLAVSAILAIALLLYLRLDPNLLQMDRWSALDNFLTAFFDGVFPYQAKTHLNHIISGFPTLFLLAMPFHLLGNVGLMQFVGIVGLIILIEKKFKDIRVVTFLVVLLLGLPALSYEVFARSDLFLNMVVVAWLIHSGKELERSRGWRLLLWGMAWGLMLSTRGIVILPLIFSGLYLIKGRDWKNKGGFALVLGLTTFLTFVPFYLWDPQLFWLNNPLDVQSGYIPSWALAFVILTCIGIGIRFCFGSRLFFHTGFSIFITVLGCYILKSIQMGWITALWENIFDITYFSMSIPFLILSLGESLASPSPLPQASIQNSLSSR